MITKQRYLLLILFASWVYATPAISTIVTVHQQDVQQQTVNKTNDTVELKKFSTGFKQKYKKDKAFDYKQELKKESTWQKIKAWVRNLLQKLLNPFEKSTIKTDSFFDIFLPILSYIAIFILLFYIVKAIIKKDVYWFIKKKKTLLVPQEILTPEDLINTDFSLLILKEKEGENYRACVRFYYLWLLQSLQNEQHIHWDINKTDTDYITEIKDIEIKEKYSYLVYLYKHIWYGEHEPTEREFTVIESSFKAAIKD